MLAVKAAPCGAAAAARDASRGAFEDLPESFRFESRRDGTARFATWDRERTRKSSSETQKIAWKSDSDSKEYGRAPDSSK